MRLFSADGSNRIGVYVIETGHFTPQAPIKGQACKKYFYSEDGGAEKAFGKMEDKTAPILKSIAHCSLPDPTSYEYEALMFYLGMQHSRTVDAAAQFAEGAEKTVRFLLRTKLELEGNHEMLEKLDLVTIERTNPVGDTIAAATVGASLLTDLALMLIVNESDVPFVSSDAPVVLHNQLYEASPETDAAGYASVGLQLFIALGPRHLLLCYDRSAYAAAGSVGGIVTVQDASVVRLLNDLQWEAANDVILTSHDMAKAELDAQAARWRARRSTQRTVFRSEIAHVADGEHAIRHGVGATPSTIKVDLPFLPALLPAAPPLGRFEIAPVRSPEKVAKAERAFTRMDEMADALRRRRGEAS